LLDSIPEVTLYLLMDEQWELAYADRLAVVLVRRDRNTLPIIDKAPLLDYLQKVLERTLAATPDDTQAHVQYGRYCCIAAMSPVRSNTSLLRCKSIRSSARRGSIWRR